MRNDPKTAPLGFSKSHGLVLSTVVVALVLLTAVTFPFIARVSAANSIPELDTAAAQFEESGTSRSHEDLGVRELPLLAQADLQAFEADAASAILAASSAVFDDSADAFSRVAESERRLGGDRIGDSDQGDVDLGAAVDVVDETFANKEPKEGDVLRLVGFLLLNGANNTIHSDVPKDIAIGGEALAVALADRTAGQFGSCDSKLARAHTRSLLYVRDPAKVDALFAAAVVACGADVTPAVSRAYYDLGFASAGQGAPCVLLAENVGPSAWDSIVKDFRDVQRTAPTNPAGYVGEGDTYRIAAEVLGTWDVQPFTVRAFLRSAVTAYAEARNRSSAPDIAISQAKAHHALGQDELAMEILAATPSTTLDQPGGRLLQAEVVAGLGHYREASRLASFEHAPAGEAKMPGSETMAYPLVGMNAAFDPAGITGLAVSATSNLLNLGPCGGSSLAHDYGFTPTARAPEQSPSVLEVQRDYAILGKDWDDPPQLCEEPHDPADLPCEILLAHGDVGQLSGAANDYIQNLLRGAGDLEGAAAIASAWVAANRDSPTAHERLGEIRILQKEWRAAADESAAAAKAYAEGRTPDGAYTDRSGQAWAWLRSAVAEREAGRPDSALELLDELTKSAGSLAAEMGRASSKSQALLAVYVDQELGVTEFALGHEMEALNHLKRSITLANGVEKGATYKVNRGLQAQVASAASLKLEQFDEARSYAQQALDIDPFNPLFRETHAEAQRSLGKRAAVEAYLSALEQDPTLFSTWNNLGVLQYQVGNTQESISSFEHALAIRPKYATAWFNLGVAQADVGGVGPFVRSQGALGKAASIDGSFKNQNPTVTFDEEIYDAGLDLSRPVPVEWQLADTSRANPGLLGIGLLFMLLLRIVWAIASDWLVGRGVEHAILQEFGGRVGLRRLLRARPRPIWTTLVSLIALVVLAGASGLVEVACSMVVFGALIGAHMLAPWAAGGGISVRHASFLPASALTMVLAIPGFGFTPPPPIANDDTQLSLRVRRSGVLVLGSLTLVLGLVAWLSAVPLSRSAATAGLLLVSSALVPVVPLDGARLGLKRSLELAVTVTVGAVTVLFAAGVV